MEEISLHGNILGSYSKHDSHLRLWGGEYESESRSLKLLPRQQIIIRQSSSPTITKIGDLNL